MTEECAITPDEVVQSYRKLGVKAMQDGYVSIWSGELDGCCGLSAVALARASGDEVEDLVWALKNDGFETLKKELQLEDGFAQGFIAGFDGGTNSLEGSAERGRKCGIAAWEEVVAANLASDDDGDYDDS
jgi:hypothetical protein